MSAISVLYVSTVSALGGAERSLLAQVQHQDPEQVRAVAALPSWGPLADALACVGTAVHIVPALRRLRRRAPPIDQAKQLCWLMGGAVTCAGLAARERVHIVHANTTTACLYAALTQVYTRPALIWHLRDFDATPALVRLLMVASSHVVAPSRAIASQLGTAYRSRVSILANGVVAPEGAQLASPKFARRTVVVIGQLVPWKDHARAVQVAEVVAKRMSLPVKFRIVGGPPPGESDHALSVLRDQVRSRHLSEIVEVMGHREDVADILAGADLLLHIAYPEPFGRVVVEAMLMGVPVVALAGDHGPAEIIDHDVTGLLLQDHSTEAIADCVQRLLESPTVRRRLGIASRRIATATYSPPCAAQRIVELYQSLVLNDRFTSNK